MTKHYTQKQIEEAKQRVAAIKEALREIHARWANNAEDGKREEER